MRMLLGLLVVSATLVATASPAVAHGSDRCSTAMLAGRWLFATGIGHQALATSPAPPGDITALGTMNIRANGDVEGTFDVTFEGFASVPGVPYTGTIVVNEDCTGVLSFVTGTGSTRTDTIAVLSRYEMWGMSRDPNNLWTYQVRRLSGRAGFDLR